MGEFSPSCNDAVDFAISKWCKKFIDAMDSENRRTEKLQKLFCGWRSYQAGSAKPSSFSWACQLSGRSPRPVDRN